MNYQQERCAHHCFPGMSATEIRGAVRKEVEAIEAEKLLRYSYVPFCLAEGAWDYAETVIDVAITGKMYETKPLTRRIRALRKSYDRQRDDNAYSIGMTPSESRKMEIENFEIMEEESGGLFTQLNFTIRNAINKQYPSIDDNRKFLLTAIWTCHYMCKVVIDYTRKQGEIIRKRLGLPSIGDILPREIYQLDSVVLEFAKDTPLAVDMSTFVDALVNALCTIGFNEVDKNGKVKNVIQSNELVGDETR